MKPEPIISCLFSSLKVNTAIRVRVVMVRMGSRLDQDIYRCFE